MQLRYNIKPRKPTLEILSILIKSASFFPPQVYKLYFHRGPYICSVKEEVYIYWLFDDYMINSHKIHNIFGYRWQLFVFLLLYSLKDL